MESVSLVRSHAGSLLISLSLLHLVTPSVQAAIGGVPADPGTVDTLAGPGFCGGTTRRDPASATVRALAVGPSGRVFFDTGPPHGGSVAVVDPEMVNVQTRAAGVAVERNGADMALSDAAAIPAASRLGSDGEGWALAAVGDGVVRVGDGRTVAGRASGAATPGTTGGDGGAAGEATFTSVRSIATDPSGNLYIADAVDLESATFRIRFVNRGQAPITFYDGTPQEIVTRPGEIATIAGGSQAAPPEDGETAMAVKLQGVPPAMAATGALLYLGTQWSGKGDNALVSRLRVINLGAEPRVVHGVEVLPGAIRTIAGGSASGFGGDGGPALAASFGFVPGIAADGNGALYLADEEHHRVRRVDDKGVIATFAGSGGTSEADGGYGGNGGLAVDARLNRPFDVKLGPEGTVYVSDGQNGQVRHVDSTGIIRSLPHGFGSTATCSDDVAPSGGATMGRPRSADPQQVISGSDGSVYFTGRAPDVKRVDGAGTVTSAAGFPSPDPCPPWPPGCPTDDAGTPTSVRLDRPTSLAARKGGFYVFDSGHRGIRFVSTSSKKQAVHGVDVRPGEMRMVVSGRQNAIVGDLPGPVNELAADSVLAASIDGGELFVGDPGTRTVWRVDRAGKVSAAVLPPASDDSCCGGPLSLATTDGGGLYILDGPTNRVWFWNGGSATVRVLGQRVPKSALLPVVGNGASGIAGEGGRATAAELLGPTSIATGIDGDLYIADREESAVHRVDGEGIITTVVGSGTAGFNGDGLRGRLTRLHRPTGVAVDHCGNLLIADSRNDRLRRLNVAAACPPAKEPRSRGASSPWGVSAAGLGGAAVMVLGVVLLRRRHLTKAGPVSRPTGWARWSGRTPILMASNPCRPVRSRGTAAR